MFVASVIGIAVSYVADQCPELQGIANRAAWQVPLALFLLTLIPAAMHASYKIYEDAMERFVSARTEVEELKERLAERVHYESLATHLSRLHSEASDGWINQVPSNDLALEKWRPAVNEWRVKVKQILVLHKVPARDIDHFEVVNNLDIEKFNHGIPDEVRKMWVRVERVAQLAKKYEEQSQKS